MYVPTCILKTGFTYTDGVQLVGRKFALAGLAIGKGQVVRVPVEHVIVGQNTEGLALAVK